VEDSIMDLNSKILGKRCVTQVMCAFGLFVLLAAPVCAQEASKAPAQQSAVESSTAGNSGNAVHSYPFSERFRDYRHSTYRPTTLIVVAAGAVYGQIMNSPPEWNQGMKGYGIRLASGYGRFLAFRTISFGVATLDHEDTRYVPCDCPKSAIWRRLGHALLFTIISPLDGGGRTFAFSRVAGAYGGAFIADTWFPPKHSDPWHAARLGTHALGVSFGINVLQEFLRFGRH
jgi:hypothetical protein